MSEQTLADAKIFADFKILRLQTCFNKGTEQHTQIAMEDLRELRALIPLIPNPETRFNAHLVFLDLLKEQRPPITDAEIAAIKYTSILMYLSLCDQVELRLYQAHAAARMNQNSGCLGAVATVFTCILTGYAIFTASAHFA